MSREQHPAAVARCLAYDHFGPLYLQQCREQSTRTRSSEYLTLSSKVKQNDIKQYDQAFGDQKKHLTSFNLYC